MTRHYANPQANLRTNVKLECCGTAVGRLIQLTMLSVLMP